MQNETTTKNLKTNKIMEKEFIPYEQALGLKELGFDEHCNTCYDKLQMVSSYGKDVFDYKNYNTSGYVVSRPTFSQAFRWFREKYGLHPHICYLDEFEVWHYDIYKLAHGLWIKPKIRQKDTYEKAELECLKKLIETFKNK